MIFKNLILRFLFVLEFVLSTFSPNEFKRFLKDNRGGLVLSFGDIGLSDKDWLEYRLLKVDESVKSINPKDLPSDFCPKACRLVEEFHRKTVNQDIEWMLYFDYKTGEVIYCWKGEEGKTGGLFNDIHFKGKHIS